MLAGCHLYSVSVIVEMLPAIMAPVAVIWLVMLTMEAYVEKLLFVLMWMASITSGTTKGVVAITLCSWTVARQWKRSNANGALVVICDALGVGCSLLFWIFLVCCSCHVTGAHLIVWTSLTVDPSIVSVASYKEKMCCEGGGGYKRVLLPP